MAFQASLSGPRGTHHFRTLRRNFVESGDINETAEALTAMIDPVEFVLGNASAPARAVIAGRGVIRATAGAAVDEIADRALEALDSWNPMTIAERMWSSELDDMVHRELMSALIVCLLDLRTRTEELAFVITHYGPQGMFGGMFQVGRDHQTSVLRVDRSWEPSEIGAKLVKKLRKVGLNDWGHLIALCHLFGSYCSALSSTHRHYPHMAVGLNFYDA